MNIKKFLIGSAASALMLGALAVPAFAATGTTHRNVGTATGLSGIIPDGLVSSMASTDMVGYTCGSVHEKIVTGITARDGTPSLGYEDKQSCTLAAGSALPKKATTYTPGNYWNLSLFTDALPALWLSDYQYTANNVLLWADNWSYTITPQGTVNITSFYSFAHDTCQYNLTTGVSDYCF